jgi:hypothetical protein
LCAPIKKPGRQQFIFSGFLLIDFRTETPTARPPCAPSLARSGSTRCIGCANLCSMANESGERSPLDILWEEYGEVFRDFDDLTLARWLAQTLGQLQGRAWRMSHPLVAAYRLAAQEAHRRGVWLKRLATPPAAYPESPCCRAPMLPLLTRDVRDTGLLCQHCNETLVPFEELPEDVRPDLELWAAQYAPVHGVAHWDDRQRKAVGNYDRALDQAAEEAERLLVRAGSDLAPRLLDFYPAVIWEDQDECLDVRPEDVLLEPPRE